jgi:hypothetical protein
MLPTQRTEDAGAVAPCGCPSDADICVPPSVGATCNAQRARAVANFDAPVRGAAADLRHDPEARIPAFEAALAR